MGKTWEGRPYHSLTKQYKNMFEKNVVHFIYCDVEYQLAEVRSGLGAAGEGGVSSFFVVSLEGRL